MKQPTFWLAVGVIAVAISQVMHLQGPAHDKGCPTMTEWFKAWGSAFNCKDGTKGELVEFRALKGGKVEAIFGCPEKQKI